MSTPKEDPTRPGLRAQIEDKVRRGMEKREEFFLNNFECRFPIDEDRTGPNTNYRALVRFLGKWDKTPREVGDDDPASGYSELYINQTYGEHFDAIDRATTEEGFSLQDIEQLRNELLEGGAKWQGRHFRLDRMFVPIYINLRMAGYTHNDLTR